MALVPLIFFVFFGFLLFLFYQLTLKKSNLLVIVSLLTALLFLLLLGYLLYDCIYKLDKIDDYGKLGPYGDYIGGILNPFISVFAVIAAGFAFYAQYQANKQVQEQFIKQEEKDYRQNFESTFFNMLTIHHDIVKNIDFNVKKIYENDEPLRQYILKKEFIKNGSHSFYDGDQQFSSRDVFKFSLDILYDVLNDELIFDNKIEDLYYIGGKINSKLDAQSLFNSSNFETNKLEFKGVSLDTKFQSIYDTVYFKLNTDFGHYFRNVYRIIKMIDEKKFDDNIRKDFKIKYSYTSIIRAQLSDDEIVWLFFNCLSNKGSDKFKPLLEKYTMLKIMGESEIELYNYYSECYEPSAFYKPEDDKLLEHVTYFNNKKLNVE